MDGMEAQLAQHQHLTIVEPQSNEGRRALAIHDHGDIERSPQPLGGGEMIRVGVRVDDIVDAHPRLRRQGKIMIDLPNFRVDERRDTGLRAAHKIGLAATGGNLLEDHCYPRDTDPAEQTRSRAQLPRF